MSKRVYKINRKTSINYTDVEETNPNTVESVDTPMEDTVIIPEIDFIPEIEEIVEETSQETSLMVLPDQWKVKTPEDETNPILLNFYKGKNVITTLPLTQENLENLMPILNKIYVRPEDIKKPPFYKTVGKWAIKHKFSAVVLTFILGSVIYSLGYTVLISGLGLNLGG